MADGGRIVTAAQCRKFGLGTEAVRARCEAGLWRPLYRGIYLTDTPDETARTRIAAALTALGPKAVAVHETAAEIHGLDGAPRSGAIHVSIAPGSARAHRGDIRIHQSVFADTHVVEVDGIRVTSPHRTVADLLRVLDRPSAVSVVDSALRKGLITTDDSQDVLAMTRRRRGASRARDRILLADGRAESPLETRARLICVDGGIPPDELQYPIGDRFGALIAVADMAWTKQRVVAEADGAGPHSEPGALFRDRRRQNDLVNEGWTVLRFTWADTQRPAYLLATVRRALHRRTATDAAPP